jgi:hypothetical protein
MGEEVQDALCQLLSVDASDILVQFLVILFLWFI